MRVTVLGCGTSSGVPLIGCACAVCTSPDPRNKRRRCSILVETAATRVIVDTGATRYGGAGGDLRSDPLLLPPRRAVLLAEG
jgi:phosphoribosyl 1,2-cyclic phosphodiesterase